MVCPISWLFSRISFLYLKYQFPQPCIQSSSSSVLVNLSRFARDFSKLLFHKTDFVSSILSLQNDLQTQPLVLQNDSIFRKRFSFVLSFFFFFTEVIKNEVIRVGPNPMWLCILLYKGEPWTQRQQEQKRGHRMLEEGRKAFPVVVMTSMAAALLLLQATQLWSTFWCCCSQGIQLPSKIKFPIVLFPLPLFITLVFSS